MGSSKEVVVFGSIVQDLFNYAPRFPHPGESVRGTHFSIGAGGKGANAATMAAKLGSKVTMIARVGNDYFGGYNIDALNAAGIETKYIEKSDTLHTATATVLVSEEGENSIVVTLGACMELSPERARELTEVIANAGLVLCQNEVPYEANLEAFRIAKEHGVTTFFNPAPGLPNLEKTILQYTDITEFILDKTLKTYDEFKSAASEILSYGAKLAIVTLGPDGAIIAYKKNNIVEIHCLEAPKVEAVDTTGAGDCFCGSLAHFLNVGVNGDVVPIVQKAIDIASVSVQRKGTQTSYPTLEELKEMKIISA